MNESELWLWGGIIAVLIIGVGISLLGSYLRKRDFERQHSGKIPERKLKKPYRERFEEPKPEDPYITANREGLRMKGGQNLLGPH